IDFMPVGRALDAGAHDYARLNAPGWLVRRIEGLKGAVEMVVRYRPSRAFARLPTELAVEDGVVHGAGVPSLFTDLDLKPHGDRASGRFTLYAGDYRDLVLAEPGLAPGHPPNERVSELFRITRAFWQEWSAYCRYRGPYRAAVERSALALKLLTYAPSGALVGALTACLPEAQGGPGSRDDRVCRVRSACAALFVLAALGYPLEAERFYGYLARASRRSLPRLQARYPIEPGQDSAERVLDHLEGYAGGRPVRVGNGGHGQAQIGLYGEALDLALLYEGLGGALGEQDRRWLASCAELVAHQWQTPDQGPWQIRGVPRQYVHSKLMSWVAADRARRLFEDGEGWGVLADRIRDEIARAGVDPLRGHLAQAFDGGVDAATLLAPMMGLPTGPQTLAQTVDTVEHTLAAGDFLSRYAADDGRAAETGACLVSSFWLVDAKLALGRIAEATALFERLLRSVNDVGLLAAAIDPWSGALLGNLPSAGAHLALIETAFNLQLCQRRGPAHLAGSYADRARQVAGGVFGRRGLWARLRRSQRVGRVRSSAASRLAWP
ncbi:MAG TPA: glycoside hydrolase family 15 protein, partial [Geminicoccaceae bacterium]|nr:glycoside hydrolase family 15 protein [Geminicoccaceae bacterium]